MNFGGVEVLFQVQIQPVFSIKGEKKGKRERRKEKLINLSITMFLVFSYHFSMHLPVLSEKLLPLKGAE